MRLFLVSFFLIYGGMHLYVFMKTRAAFPFGIKIGIPLAIWMALMVIAPIIVFVSESRGHEFFARRTAFVAYVWLGLLFLFISTALAIDTYRLVVYVGGYALKKDISKFLPAARTLFFAALTVAVVFFAYGYRAAKDIRTERVSVTSSKIRENIKIVQISDVHLGLIVRAERLGHILDKVKEENPDILVSTGDLVDGQINSLPGLAEMLQGINPRLGKYAITGNHEYYAGIRQATDFTNKAGFRILRNEGLTVGDVINIAGVDDPTGKSIGIESPNTDETEILKSMQNDKFTLFLKHRPWIDERSAGLFDLQLSGHTHKGQIFPFRYVVKIPYPFLSGLFKLTGDSRLYVSRGTGTWGPPIRVFSPPEITVIELVSDSKTQ